MLCWFLPLYSSSLELIELLCFWKLTADHWFLIELRAHVFLICSDQGRVVRKAVHANQN